MTKIIFICDFFLEHLVGGGELNDNELIKMLEASNFNIERISTKITKRFK